MAVAVTLAVACGVLSKCVECYQVRVVRRAGDVQWKDLPQQLVRPPLALVQPEQDGPEEPAQTLPRHLY